MSNRIKQTVPGVNALLDCLLARGGLKNDAALSRALGIAPPVISKLRSGKLELGATLVLNIHELFDMSIREMKEIVSPRVEAAA